MNNFEFLNYKQYSRDQSDPKLKYNPIASATVRANLFDSKGHPIRILITMIYQGFGEGEPFWQEISAGVGEPGKDKKSYLKGCLLDSTYDRDNLIEFIKENVEKQQAERKAITASVAAIRQDQTSGASLAMGFGGVAVDEQLPF